MKQIKILLILWATMACLTACSSSDDKNDPEPEQTGISDPSWTEGQELEITTQGLTISFTAYGNWTATSNASWCQPSQPSGTKGSISLLLEVTGETTIDRTATIIIRADGAQASTFKVTQKAKQSSGDEPSSEDVLVNKAVDEYLSELYLWNDEWKGLTKDFNQDYETFFYGNLQSMKTNTLDYKKHTSSDGSTYYTLFSNIQKRNKITDTRATQIEKELEYSCGITNMIAVYISQTDFILCPEGIYPDSPASEVGLKRGAYIYKVNGKSLTESNVDEVYRNLLLPDAATSFTVTEWIEDESGKRRTDGGKPSATRDVTLNARAMYKNPILHHEVITTDAGQKVGYLAYDNFDAGFDEELFSVFKEFKTAGIQDMVLDLRYNPGGHVITANMIASCVAGSYCKGKVFAKYRYNAERMKNKFNDVMPEDKFSYSNYINLGTNFSLGLGDLSLNRLYCLVGSGTASASELVINALRGIDIDVILIGETTTGKNVGMEWVDKEVNGDTYRITPITFQTYNAKGFGDYENGFTPNIVLDETDADGDGYFDDYLPYGDRNEPMLARALQEITGTQTGATTRSIARTSFLGKMKQLPAIHRLGHEGMIKKYQPAAE